MLLELGFAENYVFNALCSFTITGVVMIVVVTHVGDILWTSEPDYEHVIGSIKEILKMGDVRTDQCEVRLDQCIPRERPAS